MLVMNRKIEKGKKKAVLIISNFLTKILRRTAPLQLVLSAPRRLGPESQHFICCCDSDKTFTVNKPVVVRFYQPRVTPSTAI